MEMHQFGLLFHLSQRLKKKNLKQTKMLLGPCFSHSSSLLLLLLLRGGLFHLREETEEAIDRHGHHLLCRTPPLLCDLHPSCLAQVSVLPENGNRLTYTLRRDSIEREGG